LATDQRHQLLAALASLEQQLKAVAARLEKVDAQLQRKKPTGRSAPSESNPLASRVADAMTKARREK
jgi:hypothetical protein